VGSAGVGEGESGSEVSLEVGHLLDVLQELGIDSFLDGLELSLELGLGLLAALYLFESDL